MNALIWQPSRMAVRSPIVIRCGFRMRSGGRTFAPTPKDANSFLSFSVSGVRFSKATRRALAAPWLNPCRKLPRFRDIQQVAMETRRAMTSRLKNVIEGVFDEVFAEVERAATFSEIENWDSLNYIRLVVAIQAEFGVELT